MNEARIDKWLWAARIFKTRSIAVDAIKNGRVTIQGVNVKPSRMVKEGEVVSVRKPPVTYSFNHRAEGRGQIVARDLRECYAPRSVRVAGNESHQRFCGPSARYGTPHQEGAPRPRRVPI